MKINKPCSMCKGSGIYLDYALIQTPMNRGHRAVTVYCDCPRGAVVLREHKLTALIKNQKMKEYIINGE